MKETYFTEAAIAEEAKAILAEISAQVSCRDYSFRIAEAALLVLDMQNYFLDRSSHAYVPSAKAIVPVINSLADNFISLNRPVILTRHINNTENAGRMADWWSDLINENDRSSEIIDELKNMKSNVIGKCQYDAFYRTELEELLADQNIEQVVVCGVMTHLCCETTARSAFVRGFEVFFPIDATATYNRDFHKASLLNLAHGFAHVALSKDILASIKGDNAN
jgi:isochorismate hydrolase